MTKHAKPAWTRRSFMAGVGVAGLSAAASGGSPVAGLNPRSVGANGQVRLAIIGCGVRGVQLLGNLPSSTRVVAVADPDVPKAEALANQSADAPVVVDDYRRLMERNDLDGVVIASTDHHHVHAGVLASVAGIDSYIEKPLSTYFAESKALVEAARRHERVVQVGTQQRSMEMNRFACEFVRDGGIGEVQLVECMNYASSQPYPPDGLPPDATPARLNWDAWLGPAPFRPYSRQLAAHWSEEIGSWWGDWREYSMGQIGGMGAHSLDMVQYALGEDAAGPVEFWHVGPDQAGNERVDFRYASGVEVRLNLVDQRPWRGPRLGAIFTGSRCKIEINRNKFRTNPPDFVRDGPDPAVAEKWEGPGWVAREHVEDWLDAMQTRRRPRADIEIGHRTVTIGHVVTITRALGRRLRWDPERQRFPEDEDANALLDRPRRRGWELPEV